MFLASLVDASWAPLRVQPWGLAEDWLDLAGPGQCDQWVSTGHTQRLEVLEVAGQQQQAGVLGQRRNRDISKTWVAALRHGGIRNLPREPGGARVQRQDAVCIGGQQPVQPAVEPVGALFAAGAAQFANALRHFGDGDGGQKKFLVMRLQPFAQGCGHNGFTPRCQHRHHTGVKQIPARQNQRPAMRWCRAPSPVAQAELADRWPG